jgi:hypothetical protein
MPTQLPIGFASIPGIGNPTSTMQLKLEDKSVFKGGLSIIAPMMGNVARFIGFVICFYAIARTSFGQQTPVPCTGQETFQDCPGAQYLHSSRTTVSVAGLVGSGCRGAELPAYGRTCLEGGEHKAAWFIFEVFPLAGGGQNEGDAAGTLRFKITPLDAVADSVGHTTVDNGLNLMGQTDFDFALFDVSGLADRGSACAAIAAANAVGTPNSRQVACNYTGLAGPTGLYDLGTGFSADDNRYSRVLPVRVGQVFVLVIDNYSRNATEFEIAFGQASVTLPAGVALNNLSPSAGIVPADSGMVAIALPRVRQGQACGNELEITFPHAVPYDSVTRACFRMEAGALSVRPTAIRPVDGALLTGNTRKYVLEFAQKLPMGMIQLEQTAYIADPFQRMSEPFTQLLQIAPAATITVSQIVQAGQPFRMGVTFRNGYQAAGWVLPVGILGGDTAAVHQTLISASPGKYRLGMIYRAPSGCMDTVYTTVPVLAPTATVRKAGSLGMRIWPVPARNTLNVELTGLSDAAPARLELRTIAGVLVWSGKAATHISNHIVIDLAAIHSLTGGVYVLQIETAQAILRQRIVVEGMVG